VVENNGTGAESGAGAWRSRSGNHAGSGGYRNRFERRAAFLPLMLRSHALVLSAKFRCQRTVRQFVVSGAMSQELWYNTCVYLHT